MARNALGVRASVIYYGRFNPADDLSRMRAVIIGHFAERDRGIRVDRVREFQATLKTLEGEHEIYIYPNTHHGFANSTSPIYNQPAAEQAWERTIDFLAQASLVHAPALCPRLSADGRTTSNLVLRPTGTRGWPVRDALPAPIRRRPTLADCQPGRGRCGGSSSIGRRSACGRPPSWFTSPAEGGSARRAPQVAGWSEGGDTSPHKPSDSARRAPQANGWSEGMGGKLPDLPPSLPIRYATDNAGWLRYTVGVQWHL